MNQTIQIKRGNNINLGTLNLLPGEPAFTLDTGKLYIGNGTDKILINPDILSEENQKILYISSNGNDNIGNGTDSNPYATINKAISTLKKNLLADITISLSDGIYKEDIIISDFYGNGKITIKSTNGVSSNCAINSINILNCSKPVEILNINIILLKNTKIYISNDINADGCIITNITDGINILTTTNYILSIQKLNYTQIIYCSPSTIIN